MDRRIPGNESVVGALTSVSRVKRLLPLNGSRARALSRNAVVIAFVCLLALSSVSVGTVMTGTAAAQSTDDIIGNEEWSEDTQDDGTLEYASYHEESGTVYFASDSEVYGLDANDGSLKHQFSADREVFAVERIGDRIGIIDANPSTISATSETVKFFDTDGNQVYSEDITFDGGDYAGDSGDGLFVVSTDNEGSDSRGEWFAINPETESIEWTKDTGGGGWNAGGVGFIQDSGLFILADATGSTAYAVNADDGSDEWSSGDGIDDTARPVGGGDDTVLVGYGETDFVLLDDAGNQVWQTSHNFGSDIGQIAHNGQYYFVEDETNGELVILREDNGSVEETFGTNADSAAIGSGSIFTSGGSVAYSYRDTGAPPAQDLLGTVTDQDNDPIEGVNITIEEDGQEVAYTTTNSIGDYSVGLYNGTYNVTASKQNYSSETEQVTVSGEDQTVDFQLSEFDQSITLDSRMYMEYGQEAPYDVVVNVDGDRRGVTEESTVTSGNTSVVTIDSADREVVATNDTSVNQRTYVQAEWTDDEGNAYTTRRNVTVANATVENIQILPDFTRFTASLSDETVMVIIIATGVGAAAALFATSFAGVSAVTMVMLLGWLAGYVNNGMAILAVLMAMFVGMNVAGNVDYTVRR